MIPISFQTFTLGPICYKEYPLLQFTITKWKKKHAEIFPSNAKRTPGIIGSFLTRTFLSFLQLQMLAKAKACCDPSKTLKE